MAFAETAFRIECLRTMRVPPGNPGMPLLRPRCFQHLEREAIGICVVCHRPLCAECTTPIEGINRCAACVASLRPAVELRSALTRDTHPELRVENILGLLFMGGLLFVVVLGLTYCGG